MSVGIYNIPDADSTCTLHIHVAVGFVVPSARGNSLILEGTKRSYIHRCLEDETLCIKSDGKGVWQSSMDVSPLTV